MTGKKVVKKAVAVITPMQMIGNAISDPQFDVAKLEKMMELQEKWEDRQAVKDFAVSMSEFQSIMPVITKSKSYGPGNRKITYAPLEQIMETIRKPLGEAGLSIRFDTKFTKVSETDLGYMNVTCFVRHSSGHTETTEMSVSVDKGMSANDSQKMGSALSYARRYALIAALNLVMADEDDDAVVIVEFINVDQVTVINDLLKESGANEQLFLKWCKSLEVILIPVSKFDACVARLRDLRDIYPQRDKVTT